MTLHTHRVRLHMDSPLGPLLLAASENGLAGVWFSGQKHHPAPELQGRWPLAPNHPLLVRAAGQLERYFQPPEERAQAQRPASPGLAGWAFDLPLDLSAGSPFQQSVWRALLDIAPGTTCSYADIAHRIGRPGAARAVGAAVGRNPLSIVVPCHRVLGSSGRLTGYAGGLERKAALLRHEGHRPAWPDRAVSATAGAQADQTADAAAAAATATDTATSTDTATASASASASATAKNSTASAVP